MGVNCLNEETDNLMVRDTEYALRFIKIQQLSKREHRVRRRVLPLQQIKETWQQIKMH